MPPNTIPETVDEGWASAHTLGFGAASLALLAAFVRRQATARNPLVPLRRSTSRSPQRLALKPALVAGQLLDR